MICYICHRTAHHLVHHENEDRATCVEHTGQAVKAGYSIECLHR